MKRKISLILGITASLIFISTSLIFSQESNVEGAAALGTQSEPEIQWVWGEVVTLDTENKMILVKYLDYESDQEKEININVDDKTTYENIKSIDELKPKDTVSIDYIVSPDGKNIAKNISIEKPENTQEMQKGSAVEEQKLSPPVEEQKLPSPTTEEGATTTTQ